MDQLPNHQVLMDQLLNDKLPIDKLPIDQLPIDPLPSDQLQNDKLQIDQLPWMGGLRVKSKCFVRGYLRRIRITSCRSAVQAQNNTPSIKKTIFNLTSGTSGLAGNGGSDRGTDPESTRAGVRMREVLTNFPKSAAVLFL